MDKDQIVISIVPRDKLALIWPKVSGFLEAAIDTVPSQTNVERVRQEAESSRLSIWVVSRGPEAIGAFTTKIYQTNRGRSCAVEWLGGRHMLRWIHELSEIVEKYARKQDCIMIEGYGRMAWLRLLERHGFELQTVAFTKKLRDF